MLSTSQSISSSFMNPNNTGQQNVQYDPNFIKYRQCFKNSIRELDLLLKEISTKTTPASSHNSTPKEDRIHGYLLIILEIVKFSGLEFEQEIQNSIPKYNWTEDDPVHDVLSNMPKYTPYAILGGTVYCALIVLEGGLLVAGVRSKVRFS